MATSRTPRERAALPVFAATLARLSTERPLAVAAHGEEATRLAVPFVEILLEKGVRRFHLDCFGASEATAVEVRRRALRAGVDGYVSCLIGGHAEFGLDGYDVHFVPLLRPARDGEETLRAIATSMRADAIVLVDGHAWTRKLAPEAEPVLRRLEALTSPRHRPDRTRDGHDPSPGGATVREPPTPEDSPPLIALLSSLFSFDGVFALDAFLGALFDPTSGIRLDPGDPEDRRFLAYVEELDRELLSHGRVRAGRIAAVLRAKGTDEPGGKPPGFDPPSGPVHLDRIRFEFAEAFELLSHDVSGPADPALLGEGFYAWEPGARVRWSGRTFSLRLPLPDDVEPFDCAVSLVFEPPSAQPDGGAVFLANGVVVARVENVFRKLAREPRLGIEFSTRGGPTELTCRLDRAQRRPDGIDRRELGLVLRTFTVTVRRPPRSR